MDLRQRRSPTAAKSTLINHNNNNGMNNTKTNSKNSTQDNSNANDVLGTPSILILGILATLLLSYSGYYIGSNYREQLDDKLYYNLKQDTHTLENLNCVDHNGPYTGSYYKGQRSTIGIEEQVVNEMVYWNDIPSDSNFVSPFHPSRIPRDDSTADYSEEQEEEEEKFLSFEPDRAGWNNMRMSFETVVVLAAATGRTLVIPNEKKITQIKQKKHAYKKGEEQQYKFSFQDFFHLDAISREHSGLKIITIGEFLKKQAVAGKLYNKYTDKVAYPPGNFTIFDKGVDFDWYPLYYYLRSVGVTPKWNPNECFLAIPSSPGQEAIDIINSTWHSLYNGSAIINGTDGWFRKDYINNPIPVNSNMKERMREMVGDRDEICIYDTEMQDAKLLHIQSKDGVRLLTHFYAFIFFADWKHDTWSKRFVRDHLRIRDEITCAAARVIVAVREHARKNAEKNGRRLGRNKKNKEGLYDAFHVRRGDFADQFEKTQISAEEMYNSSKVSMEELPFLLILFTITYMSISLPLFLYTG